MGGTRRLSRRFLYSPPGIDSPFLRRPILILQIIPKEVGSLCKFSEIILKFIFTLPRIVIYFFLNNQTDALIIPILFCYKPLHVSGIFSAHLQAFSTVHSALVSFMQVSDDRFQAESGWNAWKRSSENCMKHTSAEFTVENS